MKKSKCTEEQVVKILQEASSGQRTQAEVCRDHGVSQNTFYVWKRKYAGMERDDRPPKLAAQVWNSGRATPSLPSKLGVEPISSTPEVSS